MRILALKIGDNLMIWDALYIFMLALFLSLQDIFTILHHLLSLINNKYWQFVIQTFCSTFIYIFNSNLFTYTSIIIFFAQIVSHLISIN